MSYKTPAASLSEAAAAPSFVLRSFHSLMNPLPISHLAAQVRDAGQGLVLLVVPLLAAVPVAAPGTPLAVCRGVAILNLKLSKLIISSVFTGRGLRLDPSNLLLCHM